MEVKTRKKLIEVALPLDAINAACAREKSIRHGHPSTLHLWWARRPLAAARSVIFSQMVDDPSSYVDELLKDSKLKAKAEGILRTRLKRWEDAVALAKKAEAAKIKAPPPGDKPSLEEVIAEIERERIFGLIEQLVEWENTTNEDVLGKVREEIWKSWRRTCADNANHPKAKELFDSKKLPVFHDPFAGGGAIPLEAQRLGLDSYASDLNPVAVLINKAMIEIPPKFAGRPPVNPEARKNKELIGRDWKGAQGLAEDVCYYGQWMRDEAEKRIGKLYPKIKITDKITKTRPDLTAYLGKELTVIAWIWGRTVKSPNPAFRDVDVPLVTTFALGTKPGKEVYIKPVIGEGHYSFDIVMGNNKEYENAKSGTKLSRGANFRCLMSDTPMDSDYIKKEGKSGRIGKKLLAIVCEGTKGRVYLPATKEQELIACSPSVTWRPEVTISGSTQYLGVKPYGIDRFDQIFTERQLFALVSLTELINDVVQNVKKDAFAAGMPDETRGLQENGSGSLAYAEAIGSYLGLSIGRVADYCSSICTWANNPQMEIVRGTFARQALPMTWDFAEANIFGPSTGSLEIINGWIKKALEKMPGNGFGNAFQHNASKELEKQFAPVCSTDPPYYDNVPYADLADYFYIWLRKALEKIWPKNLTTMSTPKAEELVAFAYRHESKKAAAEAYFLNGMTDTMSQLKNRSHPAFPITIYYAFKQTESDTELGSVSTGWETFLEAVIKAGFSITGTWPIRTEREGRTRDIESNALASSIVLVCRKTFKDAPQITRREFTSLLKKEMPSALKNLQKGNIAPVDLAQASIGPGMAIYTRYSKILDADGKPLAVRMALALINQTLDEVLEEQEGEFDADTRWALAWFEQHGFSEGSFGDAESLSKAKVTAVNSLVDAGIIKSKTGNVALLKKGELDEEWSPETDKRLTVWEITHYLIQALDKGEDMAADLLARIGPIAEAARDLAYRLYSICEKKNWSKEGQDYNGLVQAWPNLQAGAKEARTTKLKQGELI